MLLFIRRNPLQNHSALCCLAFSSPLFSFQGASEGYTLKIEQCKILSFDFQNGLTWSACCLRQHMLSLERR